MKRLVLILTALCFTLLSYAQNLDLDRSMGEANAQMVAQEMGIYQDAAKTAYLRRVGKRLVAQLKNPLFEYQFHLVENSSPNAFALPGGYLYVTTGLLPILQSEDELACILGHEIIHSNNRHSVKQMKRSILPKLLEVPGELLGLLDNDLGAVFNAPLKTSNNLLLASYSRKFETEADKEGIALAARAGYDPNAMIPALTRLSRTMEVATDQEETKSYFSDHPFTPDRVKAIRKQITKLKWTKKDNETSNFLMEFNGALFGDSPRKGVVNDNRFMHPLLDFSIQFPEEWIVVNEDQYIASLNKEQNSGIQITFEDPNMEAEAHARKFFQSIKPEAQELLVARAPYISKGRKGYLLSFRDQVEGVEVYAYALWIPFKDHMFRFMAIATEPNLKKLEPTVASLNPLKKNDWTNLKTYNLEVVTAQKGETLESLGKRVNNKLNNDLTSVINDKTRTEPLEAGEQIKVVKSYAYRQ